MLLIALLGLAIWVAISVGVSLLLVGMISLSEEREIDEPPNRFPLPRARSAQGLRDLSGQEAQLEPS